MSRDEPASIEWSLQRIADLLSRIDDRLEEQNQIMAGRPRVWTGEEIAAFMRDPR